MQTNEPHLPAYQKNSESLVFLNVIGSWLFFRDNLGGGQTTDVTSYTDILDVLLRECRKDNVEYKQSALTATSRVIEANGKLHFEPIFTIIKPVIDKDMVSSMHDNMPTVSCEFANISQYLLFEL